MSLRPDLAAAQAACARAWSLRTHLPALADRLRDTESVLALVTGHVRGREAVVAVTDARVVVLEKARLGTREVSLPLDCAAELDGDLHLGPVRLEGCHPADAARVVELVTQPLAASA